MTASSEQSSQVASQNDSPAWASFFAGMIWASTPAAIVFLLTQSSTAMQLLVGAAGLAGITGWVFTAFPRDSDE